MASAVQIYVPSGFLSVPDFLSLLDGQPNGLATILGFNYLLLQFIEPLAAFEELAYNLVATNEDAASGVLGGIAHVDANALEKVVKVGATEQQREPHLELRTPRNHYGVTAFWDGKGLQQLRLDGLEVLVEPEGMIRYLPTKTSNNIFFRRLTHIAAKCYVSP